ncbi:hypothetical protein Peur_061879 [Populus x canadensis]
MAFYFFHLQRVQLALLSIQFSHYGALDHSFLLPSHLSRNYFLFNIKNILVLSLLFIV